MPGQARNSAFFNGIDIRMNIYVCCGLSVYAGKCMKSFAR